MKQPNTDKCEHKSGYYRYFRTKGKGACYYKPDGTQDDNSSMYDGLTIIEEKTRHCTNCHKKLKGGSNSSQS